MHDKVFRKNNFYERPWTSLLRRKIYEANLWIPVPFLLSSPCLWDPGNIFFFALIARRQTFFPTVLFSWSLLNSMSKGKICLETENEKRWWWRTNVVKRCILSNVKWFCTLHFNDWRLFNFYSVESVDEQVSEGIEIWENILWDNFAYIFFF